MARACSLAAATAFALTAVACAGCDSDRSDTQSDAADDAATALEGNRAEAVEAREAGQATGDDIREVVSGPVHGGRLVYGIEADTANPFAPHAALCAISCRMIMRAVTESLYVTDANGDIVPYLVESETPNDDFSRWTLRIRDGIRFHDGTPLTGEAVAYNINLCRYSQQTGPGYVGIDDVWGEGQYVHYETSVPFATGPGPASREAGCGFMFSPAWLETLPNNPLYASPFSPLSAEERSAGLASATGDPAAPVGLGAFRFVEYTPGNGNSFIAERNPDYWRGSNGITGENLPYLDEIEFVVSQDIQGRSSGLKAGDFHIIHTSNADEIFKYESDDDYVTLQANSFGETNFAIMNVAAGTNPVLAAQRGLDEPVAMDPLGFNAANPLVHLSCRRALAQAFDGERFVRERHKGLVRAANGPFPPGSMGYLEDSGYPEFDLDAALVSFAECKAESGQNPVTFGFNSTGDPFNVESNELIVSMWQHAFGDEISVTIQPIEQGQYFGLALAGLYEMMALRAHGGVDPIEQWLWWNSSTAQPINPAVPELAANIGRFQDPAIDAAYDVIRHNPDPVARQKAAEDVNRAFGRNVWNLWTYWTLWGIVANQRVQNITDLSIPGNDAGSFGVNAGAHHVAQIWCTDGDCHG
ncbi:ABC transporter substrate-binding protein [Candidatus Poriferisodalis sp.]|uniref:ABC transporter substrate-binding protein n=1 Tax=Candidatus Poriferisodalis sp. TaxID=3101277 RepID=UPI003B014901